MVGSGNGARVRPGPVGGRGRDGGRDLVVDARVHAVGGRARVGRVGDRGRVIRRAAAGDVRLLDRGRAGADASGSTLLEGKLAAHGEIDRLDVLEYRGRVEQAEVPLHVQR